MPFPKACYKKLLGHECTIEDLREWQPDIAKALEFILNYSDATPLEEVLGTNFTIDIEQYGETSSVELKPDGTNILVSMDNRDEYVQLYINYIFNTSCEH